MQMSYGNYTWSVPNSAEIRLSTQSKKDAAGVPYILSCRIDVNGALFCAGQADADSQTNALIAALSLQFQDFQVKLDSGSTSAIRLRNLDSISGVTVTSGPNFPNGKGAEAVTYRSFAFTIEADYPHPSMPLLPPLGSAYLGGYGGGGFAVGGVVRNPFGGLAGGGTALGIPTNPNPAQLPGTNVRTNVGSLSSGNVGSSLPGGLIPGSFNGLVITDFHESVTTSGGGPTYIYLPNLNGPPQRQLVYPVSVGTAAQSGRAVGFQDWPSPPTPLWPAYLKTQPPRITRQEPRRVGLTYQNFAIEWSYDFEAAGPLFGAPHWWPG